MNQNELIRQYQEFDTLMGGYLNGDWRLHWSTVHDVYEAAFAGMGDEGQRELHAELGRILDTYRTDEEVLGLLRAMDFNFNPVRKLGLTHRAWLEDLRDRLPAGRSGDEEG